MSTNTTQFKSHGVEFTAEYEFQVEEKQTHTDPGCPEEFYIISLTIGDSNIDWWDEFTESAQESLTNEAHEAINNQHE